MVTKAETPGGCDAFSPEEAEGVAKMAGECSGGPRVS